MKKLYLFLLLIASATMGFAQPFSISPAPVANMTIAEGSDAEATIYFRNETNSMMTLIWDRAGNTLDNAWSVSICDNNLCYFSAYPGDTMLPVSGGASGFLKFTCAIDPGDAGSGQLTYSVYAENDSSYVAEVTFDVNGIVSVAEASFANQIKISPNPVSTTLTLSATSTKLEKGVASIYDLSGRMLREVPVRGLNAMDIDVQTLPQGAYLLRYESEKGVVSRRFLKTN